MREYFRLIPGWGFKLVVAVNGHGATNQLNTIQRLVNEFNEHKQAKYIHFFPFMPDKDGNIPVGHAAKLETSIMMALYPDAVNLADIPSKPKPMSYRDWAIVDWFAFIGRPTPDRTISAEDDPRDASVQYGRNYMESIVRTLSDLVRSTLATL